MAFFNLTYLGRSNTLAELRTPSSCSSEAVLPDINNHYGKGPSGSYQKLCELKMRQIRNPKEPNQLYVRAVTCAQEIGWWTKSPPEDIKWTYVKKHVFPKSEMTWFADKMSLSDRTFRMY